jgi:hypothetical protein
LSIQINNIRNGIFCTAFNAHMVISSSDLETAIDTEISAPTVLTQPVFKP